MSRRRSATALVIAVGLTCAGCASMPEPPESLGDGYPGTCMPAEFTWPTDFLEALPSESSVGGTVVGLRLEYIDSEWAWRIRAADDKVDMFGERVDDPGFGRESLLDVRTLEVRVTHDVQLTEAEQQRPAAGAYEAAELSGEEWPSPLIIEMTRVMEDGDPVWRITTCDTATDEYSVKTLD